MKLPAPPTRTHHTQSGFTIIEILITTFLIGTVVVGVFGLFMLSLRSAQESERRVVAVALANERMEMVRNLPYLDVGTVGGVPSGPIAQEETIVRNGLDYNVQTDIRYIDDEFDGQIGEPVEEDDQITICHRPDTPAESTLTISANAWDAHQAHGDYQGECGNPDEGTEEGDLFNADYKQVRVQVSWNNPSNASPVLLITAVVPPGIEGGELGGTLDFQVLNASGVGVPTATVQVVNDDISPAINLTTQTNADGRLVIPGLPEAADSYELTVSKSGYTTEQTYDTDATFIPDTDHSHFSMIVRTITSKTFLIDQVSTINVTTQDETATALPDIAYTLRGTKTIGTNASSEDVYVVDEDATTDAAGTNTHTDIPWDSYDISLDGVTTGYDIKETSVLLPLIVQPAQAVDVALTLVPHTPLSLHVSVADATGAPIDNATVRITGGSVDETIVTGVPGQVFFDDLPSVTTYTVEVDAPGFVPASQDVPVDASERIRIDLAPSS